MRFTRAAKVAAFPLIVLALVALIACQGPAGVKGDKGDTGDTGDMGTPGGTGGTGDRGPMGHSALVAEEATEAAVHSVNDGPDDNDGSATIGDAPPSVDAGMYFSGGVPPIKYSVSRDMVDNNDGTPELPEGVSDSFTLEEMDGMLVFGIKEDLAAPTMNDYTTGSQFTLKATDFDGTTATKMVHIMANKAPTRPDTVPAFALTVGTQGAADDDRKGGDGTEEPPSARCSTCA